MREYRASSPEKDGEDVEEERIARRWIGCADSVSMKTFLALSKALLCRCFRASSAGLRPWLFFCKVPENRESRDWAGWEIGQKRTRKSGFRSQRREQYVVRKCSTRLSTSCCSFPALSRSKTLDFVTARWSMQLRTGALADWRRRTRKSVEINLVDSRFSPVPVTLLGESERILRMVGREKSPFASATFEDLRPPVKNCTKVTRIATKL